MVGCKIGIAYAPALSEILKIFDNASMKFLSDICFHSIAKFFTLLLDCASSFH